MESEFLPDKAIHTPPVPIKTYQWEDIRRAREAGGYPWTHLLKPPLEGEITAEDIIRETTPRRSMSRDVSRSRTHSPDHDVQQILMLDSSPGSSRKHGEEGEDEGIQIPNFSKEISLDNEKDPITEAVKKYASQPDGLQLSAPLEIPKNISPKSILKRRTPDPQYVPVTETRENTKCCHPLVNKIKHLADKTLHKLEKNDNEKSPMSKRKKNEDKQEIRQLKSSPGAVRRQKYSAIKLGDSDEMSKTLSLESASPPRKKKEHIYEDIEESKSQDSAKYLQFSADVDDAEIEKENKNSENVNKETESIGEKKSNASQDPSLYREETSDLRPEEYVMEKLHKKKDVVKEALVLDFDSEEPNIDEIFQNQLEELEDKDSPNITITEIIDDDSEKNANELLIQEGLEVAPDAKNWSRPNSDHEYEIIGKPPPEIVYTPTSFDDNSKYERKDDELSSTTSLERKYLQHTSDEEERLEDDDIHNEKNDVLEAEALQKDIEDRYFVNTPSTVSRTECEISTSQVDSSALENLPLKRESRSKNSETNENKLQTRFRESTGKLKSQAGKLKTKLQSIKNKQFSMPDKTRIRLPDRPKFKMPERPKISLPERPKFMFPERPKFSLPDRRKFSLPDRPKFKKINISEKLSLGDRKKFSFPERPKFNVPDMPKFKFPDKAKVNFPSFSKKKQYKVDQEARESNTDLRNVTTAEFEVKTYPRLFKRKKKVDTITSSSPTLNRDDTPPPTFTFTRMNKQNKANIGYRPDSPAEPREYGNIDGTTNYDDEERVVKQFDTTYDFDKRDEKYFDRHDNALANIKDTENTVSTPDISPSKQEYTHVINEINNDEFFVRPRGISRENIQVREYLSDEIRQAFKIPKNALASMDSNSKDNEEPMYMNETEADPELMLDENEQLRYSNEDINERDDGYYTFPPIRPNRAKRKKEMKEVKYIDESINASIQFSDVDLDVSDDQLQAHHKEILENELQSHLLPGAIEYSDFKMHTDEYDFDELVSPDDVPIECQTLPAPPKRKKKYDKKSEFHSSLNDFRDINSTKMCAEPQERKQDIIVYRTEHEYIVPEQETAFTEHSPVAPRRSRNRSRSSHGTSLCDDDRTSQGAESLILDTHLPVTEDIEVINNNKDIRHESPGYATVDKGGYNTNKEDIWSENKTPPTRQRKSHSSERKYYTVGPNKATVPNRPPRKKSSTSLMTLDSITKRSECDITQYVEIDDPHFDNGHKDLNSGEIVSKMKDRPLPPPPRPPRGPKRNKNTKDLDNYATECVSNQCYDDTAKDSELVEIEVSTQTDPLPDDVDFELGLEETLDVSMSSSLRDIVEGELLCKSPTRLLDSPRQSRSVSRSEKSIKLSDPKISELSKTSIGRTSPTVILVERRVSSPTRINEHEEIVTEASLTVQHIDVDESVIPDVPPLPKSRGTYHTPREVIPSIEDRALERLTDVGKDVQLDNLVTQRLQVKDLDVGRLNVSELQASKILVSEIEGMSLQVTELDSKSGHISVSGIELSQTIIDEIVKKFAELSASSVSVPEPTPEPQRPISREEQTQTEECQLNESSYTENINEKLQTSIDEQIQTSFTPPPPPPPRPVANENVVPPQRPPPPDLTPLLYSYLQDLTMPPASFYHLRTPRERPFTEFHESQQSPPPPTRRAKRKPAPQSDSSSDDARPGPSTRRIQSQVRMHEQTITEAGAHFFRVCHTSINRTIRNMFQSLMSYISGVEDKKDVQMALVIFLVLIAGLIMFGLSDSRTIHHHHWEFFNPPDGKQ